MSTNSKPKSLSVDEFLVGGVALASVALIALGGMHMTRPRISLLPPKRYASVSIEPTEAKLSIAQLTDVGEATHDVEPPESRPATADSSPVKQSAAEVLPSPTINRAPPVAERPARQRGEERSMEANLPEVFSDVMSGLSFSSPPRDSRLADNRQPGKATSPSAPAEPTFIGGWADYRDGCRTKRKAPLVISTHVARTADGECDFGSVVRKSAHRWRVVALCAAEGNFWRSHIALKLVEPNLTWSSERGTETYVRCGR